MKRPIKKSTKGCDEPRLDYKDTETLAKYLNPQGEIHARRKTGYCAKCQRQLKQAIKRARHMGLLAFVGQ